MNTYLKIIGLSLFLLLLCPERCLAAEPEIVAGAKAEWVDVKAGIAKVTLTESDTPGKELTDRMTDYIFMIDGSRTTTLNDSYLFQEKRADQEPWESHCPCMAEGHYYMVSGSRVLPLTYTLGYDLGTGELRSWSAGRMIWADSVGAHYNSAGRKIPVRYANGCLDIFTVFKNAAIQSVGEIAKRKDGSRIAFIVYSGDADALYGLLNYTTDYEDAIKKIREAGFEPGSLICPGIDRARSIYESGGKNRTTKLLIMGDGRNSDIAGAVKKAESFRALPGTAIYSACMGKEACVMGSGYAAMREMSGNRADRFWRIQTRPQTEMSKVFSAALSEKLQTVVSIIEKCYSGKIGGQWEYYEDAACGYVPECTAGEFAHVQDKITWKIPKDTKQTVKCSFYVRLSEEARYVTERTEYEVLEEPQISYVISGGSHDGEKGTVGTDCNRLEWNPSTLKVTKVKLLSGISYPKEEDVFFVKGGSENELGFTSYTDYASKLWKPEKNYLYEKSDYGGQTELSQSGSTRSEDLSRLSSTYPVTLYMDKEICEYYPSASIGEKGAEIFTERFDGTKKLTLICDAVAPEIEGSVPEIIREDRKLVFTAKDDGSGVQKNSFSLEVFNAKTGEKKVLEASGTTISWNIRLEDSFYSGNLKWTLRAKDNVGNDTLCSGISNIRAAKGEEEISDEIRTRILLPRSDFSVDGIY